MAGRTLNSVAPMTLYDGLCRFARHCLYRVLTVGPVPCHIGFILDGNRRYGKKYGLKEQEAYNCGFQTFMAMLVYCYEMGVEYVTMFAFSIDNFRRGPGTVGLLMGLLKEKADEMIQEVRALNDLGIRIDVLGNLQLLEPTVREAVERLMEMTKKNSRMVLTLCLAYTSTDEITTAVNLACKKKMSPRVSTGKMAVTLRDVERNLFCTKCPEPELLIRTGGETRLSNFLNWQTAACLLHTPRCLWPEFSLLHLAWAVLEYQKHHAYITDISKRVNS